MDRTLKSYLQQADDLHNYLEKYCVILTAAQIETKVTELQAAIKTLQTVSYQLANVSNIATRVIIKKRRHKTSKSDDKYPDEYSGDPLGIVSKKAIDPYPSECDIGTLRSLNPEKSIEIIKGVHIPIQLVESINEIPVSNIYFVEDLKQFAINIGGIVIRGNLGNIVNYQTKYSAICEYGSNCKSFIKKIECPYYHDPLDFKKNKMPIPDITRNFTVGSWVYSKKKTPKTYFARHIGSKDRLIHDLNTLKRVQYRDEIANRETQLIHDLLIYMILNARGFLERYPHWKNIPVSRGS